MAATYTPIATTTLGSATSSVTFNSISGSYTDLILIVSSGSTTTGGTCNLTLNNDTTTTYSYTYLEGQDGTTPNAISGRGTSTSSIPISGINVGPGSIPNTYIAQIMNYANTTTYKTVLSRSNIIRAYSAVTATVGLWRSTSAVTRIDLTHSSSTFPASSTFTLYGVKAA